MDSKLLRVKATHNSGEIRRFSLAAEDRSFTSLEQKLRALFSLPEQSPLQVSYFDEEGDEVVFSTDDEMAVFPLDQVLRLHLKDTQQAPAAADSAPSSDPPTPSSPSVSPCPPSSPSSPPSLARHAPFFEDLLPPQSGRILHPPPLYSAPSASPPPPPPPSSSQPHRMNHQHIQMGPFSAGFSFGGSLQAHRIFKLLLLSLILAALCTALFVSFLVRGLAASPPPPPSGFSFFRPSPPAPQDLPFHMPPHFFHHAGSALFMAFILSAFLSFIMAAAATFIFSKSISSFAASFSQNSELRQQRLNEFAVAASRLFEALVSQQPQPQPQPQFPHPEAQYRPPPYEGIRHRTHSH